MFTFKEGGILYRETSRKTVSVTSPIDGGQYEGDIVIPSEVVSYYHEKFQVTSIDPRAFAQGKNLVSVTVPGSVSEIGNFSFSNSFYLESVILGAGVQSIRSYAFSRCERLKNISIPASVNLIEECAFEGCTSLVNITVDEGNENYCSENGVLYRKDKSELLFHPAGKATTAYIPATVSSIELPSLQWCMSLESIEVSDENQTFCSVDGVLYDKSKRSLLFCPLNRDRDVVVADGVTQICEKAFCFNQRVENVELPDSLKEIGAYAFRACEQLRSIVIPAGVEKIGNSAFYYSSRLSDVTVKAETPPECTYSDVFSRDTYMVAKLHVPKGCKSVYGSAKGWEYFENVDEIEETPDSHTLEKGTVCINYLSGKVLLNDISCNVYVYKPGGTLDYRLNLDSGSSEVLIPENCSCDIIVGDKVTHIIM